MSEVAATKSRSIVASYFALAFISVIWGLAFVAIRQADKELSPVNLALLRWFIAVPLFLLLVPLIGRPKTRLERKDLPRLLVVAFANVVGYHISLNYAETTTSAGLSGLLISFAPVFTVILSVLLLNERAGPKVAVALLLGVFGTLVLSIGSINLRDLPSFYGPGEVVLAAAFYSLFTVLSKPLVQKYEAPSITIWSGLLGTAMMLPFLSASFVSQAELLSLEGWISVLYLSVLSTVFGYLLFFTLVSRGAVSRLSVQLYLIPVVSVVGGALLLGESVTIFTVTGGAMMLSAVAIITGLRRK
jgi:drug/metabolite transporter (DMT)-like permease